ncbi:MAG: (1-_4)-alpha-D-glucan 1-alpha-D-glucosylmutase [Chthoniobacter sp.]|jgi:(1->4)-alpha-D-glucan 1-alpha-D-glucosylmutase|nr:(1->4)-alpha-D-glucan 1-alpha-D-glucosylmutase [Chthoniobacter sp.]
MSTNTASFPSIPSVTYRLQFHKDFTFEKAKQIVPYLHALGITHVYASPYFRATPGSLHGYDICDQNELNPEVGTREEFDAFVAELQRHGMGQVLDFVPNHMGIAEATNAWWMDVLENGPSSPYARFFDIDWQPVKRELENKVLLPILGDQYGRVLEKGELKLQFASGAFSLDYYGRTLPIAPRTTRPILEQAKAALGAEKVPAELESIIGALDHLPPRTETDPAKIAERTREKELLKSRLEKLCEENAAVAKAISTTVAEMQTEEGRRGGGTLDALVSSQPYRLAYWRVASEEINYRRFFDINNLAAIRMELPEVYEATHRLVFELLASGAVTGLRIDHVDGLSDPGQYFWNLQQSYAKLRGVDAGAKPLYLLVEKILGTGEHLPGDWQVHGTTGYEAAIQNGLVLVDPAAEKAFSDGYAKFVGSAKTYPTIVYESKLLVMRLAMSSEVNALGHMLNRISETNAWYRDFTLNALTTAIREVIACFPFYRTYFTPDGKRSEEDVRVVRRAIAAARRRNPTTERTVYDFLADVLVPPADNAHPVDESARLNFVMKFQQCTGPITAKGVEDTSFYIFNRLVALNEVGGEPEVFGESVDTFHQQNQERLAAFPHSLVATSTHDTKRSEDVRARLAVLSEMPREWFRAVRRWHSATRKHLQQIDGSPAPDRNEEYLLYQTLLGSWPLAPMSPQDRESYIQRIQEYMVKALHEAKVNSSWTEPNVEWDKAVSEFVEKILTPRRGNRFLTDFAPFAERIAEFGMVNSIAQVVLKLTVPGVPDIYQGQEMWDFSLVDPDNRRPVDYEARQRNLTTLLAHRPSSEELLREWRDGRIKLLVSEVLARFRREHPILFQKGSYSPVKVAGEWADCAIAFVREHEGESLLVIVPRFPSRLGAPPVGEAWKDTRLVLNSPLRGEVRDLLSDTALQSRASVRLAEALRELPVAAYFSAPPDRSQARPDELTQEVS